MSTIDSPDRPTRVEREILEILERAEAEKHPIEEIQTAVRRKRARTQAKIEAAHQQGWSLNWSSDLVRIGASLALAIAAASTAGLSSLLAAFLAILSGVALLSLWIRTGPGGPSDRPRWRGEDLYGPRGPSLFGDAASRPWRLPKRPER